MISPTFSSGANTAERVPTTTRASPFRTRHHSRARSTSLSAECSTATPSKRAPNHDRHCRPIHKVNAISGTSTSAVFPRASVSCTARKYTSVFPLPLCTPRLRVIFSFDLFFRRLFSRRSSALPSDHPLRPAASSLHRLANFNEPAPLQPLQRGSVNSQLCCWTKQQSSFLLFQLRERRRLRGGEPMRQFTAAQAPHGFTSCIGQNNLALRFQLRHRRQHRAINFANRCQVVRLAPMRQLDQLRRQRGNKIQYAGDLANFRSLRRAFRQFHNDADHRFLSKWNEHAAAWLHRSLQCFRNCIGKRGAQRHRQCDIAKWRSHPAV